MRKTVSSTEAVRNFSDLLAEVKHGGREVLITRGSTPVARLAPVGPARTLTLREFISLWTEPNHPEPDPSFADDLEKIQRADKPARLRWPS